MPTLEYCLNNVSPEIRQRLRAIDGAVERRCLQRCGTCYRQEFVVVDGVMKREGSHDKHLNQIARIDE